VIGSGWDRVLELAWEGFCAGCAPIGAVVLDADGDVVAEARSRRHDEGHPDGELSGCRIAHAELNALAHLPTDAYYSDHTLVASVEPCCLCMGAAIQTGVGVVSYAWRDAYAGATAMVVDNPQVALKETKVFGPEGGTAEVIAGLLLVTHYALDQPSKPHVTAPMRAAEPQLFTLSERADVLAILEEGRRKADEFETVLPRILATILE
jgi:tRNA(Arg) A34 adenosine deaminase TadA